MTENLDSVRDEWLRRVEVEYQSAAIAQHFTLWLIQMGASPDLIADGMAVTTDEMIHSRLSYEVYVAAGGSDAPNLDRDSLGLRRQSESLEDDVLRVATRFFCLGETVAVPLFQHMRKTCTEEVAKLALDRIVVDEVRHRDFGWTVLEWMLDSADGDRYRQILSDILPGMLSDIAGSYGSSAEDTQLTKTERAWGLACGADYANILERTFHRDYQPRFARLGIELQSA